MAAASAQEEAGDGRGRKRRMRLARPDRTRKVQLVQSQRAVENVLPNTKKNEIDSNNKRVSFESVFQTRISPSFS